jgi:hypothetical protein
MKIYILLILIISNTTFASTIECQIKTQFDTIKKSFFKNKERVVSTSVANTCQDSDTIFTIDELGGTNFKRCLDHRDRVSYQIVTGLTRVAADIVRVDLYAEAQTFTNTLPKLIATFSINPNNAVAEKVDTLILFEQLSRRKRIQISSVTLQCNQ